MSSLQILQGTFRLGNTKTLQLPRLTLNAGDSWAFVGSNGSGKSALARALSGELPLLKGERQSQFSHHHSSLLRAIAKARQRRMAAE